MIEICHTKYVWRYEGPDGQNRPKNGNFGGLPFSIKIKLMESSRIMTFAYSVAYIMWGKVLNILYKFEIKKTQHIYYIV